MICMRHRTKFCTTQLQWRKQNIGAPVNTRDACVITEHNTQVAIKPLYTNQLYALPKNNNSAWLEMKISHKLCLCYITVHRARSRKFSEHLSGCHLG